MCCCEVMPRNHLGFRNIQLFGKYLCCAVDKEGLPGSLFVQHLNDIWSEGLSNFIRVLCKEFPHLFECEGLARRTRLGY